MKQVNTNRHNVSVQSVGGVVVGLVTLLLCSLIRLIISPIAGKGRGQFGFGSGLDFASKSRHGQMCLKASA